MKDHKEMEGGQGFRWLLYLVACFGLAACASDIPADLMEAYGKLPEEIDFNFHVRPILSDRCYACHGPDDNTREANLRIDQEEEAYSLLESGGRAIVRGDLGGSKIWERILSEDPE